jgi:Rieske Fe-S protein
MNRIIKILSAIFLFTPFLCMAGGEAKEIDLSLLKERGMLMRVLTDGRPVWIAYRTKESITNLEKRSHIYYPSDLNGIDKKYRSFNKNYFIVFGGCPEGDELPAYYPNRGFICESNCGSFDMAGRPINNCAGEKPMDIPKHYYKNERTVVIPIHQDGPLNKSSQPMRKKRARLL